MMSGQLEGEFGWDAFGETEYPAAPEGLQINKNQAKLDALLSKPVKISGTKRKHHHKDGPQHGEGEAGGADEDQQHQPVPGKAKPCRSKEEVVTDTTSQQQGAAQGKGSSRQHHQQADGAATVTAKLTQVKFALPEPQEQPPQATVRLTLKQKRKLKQQQQAQPAGTPSQAAASGEQEQGGAAVTAGRDSNSPPAGKAAKKPGKKNKFKMGASAADAPVTLGTTQAAAAPSAPASAAPPQSAGKTKTKTTAKASSREAAPTQLADAKPVPGSKKQKTGDQASAGQPTGKAAAAPKQQQQQQQQQAQPQEGGVGSQKAGKKRKQQAGAAGEEAAQGHPGQVQGVGSVKAGGGGSSGLLDKMRARLAGGRFRSLNETLYTRTGDEALTMMQDDPSLFSQYHEGFRQQTLGWPSQPVQQAARWLAGRDPGAVVVDFGCGDGQLALSVKQKVHSFDLVAAAPHVVACNMAHVPLPDASADVAVFSLALMGTDYGSFLVEAARVVRHKGWIWLAEVRSRFAPAGADDAPAKPASSSGSTEDLAPFIKCLGKLGFQVQTLDVKSNTMFFVMVLRKANVAAVDPKAIKWPPLRACVYKKR